MTSRSFLSPEYTWPGAVILLLLIGMGSAFAVLWFSNSDGGAAVVDDYYQQGVAWDSLAAAQSATDRFGWTVRFADIQRTSEGMHSFDLVIEDSAGVPVHGLSIVVAAARPQDARPRVSAAAVSDSSGHYTLRLPGLTPGLWDFSVSGTTAGEPFVTRKRLEL